MKTLFTFLATAALVAPAFAAEFPDISIAEVKTAIAEKKATVIDVNGSESYAKAHVPTAIDFAAEKDLSAKLPSDKAALVIAYCGNPNCSAYAKAAKAAKALGYTNVKHMSAGISGWVAAGEATEKK